MQTFKPPQVLSDLGGMAKSGSPKANRRRHGSVQHGGATLDHATPPMPRSSKTYKPSVWMFVVSAGLIAGQAVGCGYSNERPFPATVREATVGSATADEAATDSRLDSGLDSGPARGASGKISSVYVEPFRSKEFRRELEQRLTEAVSKQIEVDTPYRIAKRERADTTLTGEILEVRQAVFGTDFVLDRPREVATTFLVRIRWRHQGTGTILMERKVLIQTDTWVPTVGETFFSGSDRVIDQLAERIVEQMETVW